MTVFDAVWLKKILPGDTQKKIASQLQQTPASMI